MLESFIEAEIQNALSPLAVFAAGGRVFLAHSNLAFCIKSDFCWYSACACAAFAPLFRVL